MPVKKTKSPSKTKQKPSTPNDNTVALFQTFVGSESSPQRINTIEIWTDKGKVQYVKFRPYINSIAIRPPKPPDRGYYYKMYKNGISLIRNTLEDNGFRESLNRKQPWTLLWGVSTLKSQVYHSLTKYQKVNHFPRSVEITRKDCLCKNMSKMQTIYGRRHFDFVPQTFVLPQELHLLTEAAEKDPDKYWIVKPSAAAQGRGIFVTNDIGDIPEGTQCIASRYISDPLLIDGYKFDLRIYLAITSINPLRLYVFEDGLARFATCKYSPPVASNKKNRYIHLTNYSVNKHNKDFQFNENPTEDGVGSKWSLKAFMRYLEKRGVNTKMLWARIDEILIKTMLSVEPLIKSSCDMYVPYEGNCFELLGFDILLDSSFTPWLLEVNLSPSLNCDSPLDHKIKGELIADLFTLIGIVPIEQHDYSDAVLNCPLKFLATRKSHKGLKARKARANTLPSGLTKEQKAAIRETASEHKRRGRFRRIFPTVHYSYYKGFFESERPLNVAVADQLLRELPEERRSHRSLIGKKVLQLLKASGSQVTKLPCLNK